MFQLPLMFLEGFLLIWVVSAASARLLLQSTSISKIFSFRISHWNVWGATVPWQDWNIEISETHDPKWHGHSWKCHQWRHQTFPPWAACVHGHFLNGFQMHLGFGNYCCVLKQQYFLSLAKKIVIKMHFELARLKCFSLCSTLCVNA